MIGDHEKIREYEERDREQLLEFWHEFDRVHVESDSSRFRYPTEEQMTARLEKYASSGKDHGNPHFFTFVSQENDGTLGGFICGMIRKTPDAALLKEMVVVEIHGIYVKPAEKKSGQKKTSDFLLQAAIDFGKKHGAERALCGIWEFNSPSKKLFSKCGFVKISSRYEAKIG